MEPVRVRRAPAFELFFAVFALNPHSSFFSTNRGERKIFSRFCNKGLQNWPNSVILLNTFY